MKHNINHTLKIHSKKVSCIWDLSVRQAGSVSDVFCMKALWGTCRETLYWRTGGHAMT